MIDEFKRFLLRGNVIDLAVAVVMGAAFGAIVTAIVEGLVTPLLGAFGGLPDFSAWVFTINNSQFAIGRVINAIISFLAIATVVFFVIVRPMNSLMARAARQTAAAEPPAPTKQEILLSEIRDLLREQLPPSR